MQRGGLDHHRELDPTTPAFRVRRIRRQGMSPVPELPAPRGYIVGPEIPVSRWTWARLRALGGIILSTTLASNSSLHRGIPSTLSGPSRVGCSASNPADFLC